MGKKLHNLRNHRDLSFTDLLSVDQITKPDLTLLHEITKTFQPLKTETIPLCQNATQINAFFENSTRTLTSFDLAAKQLGMHTINITGTTSSTKKGESYLDTIHTLSAYHPKIITIRTAESGVPETISKHTPAAIINAGDGWHEHPTQALLDTITILDHIQQPDLTGQTITIVGDIRHSRVFGSIARLFPSLGATLRVAAPHTLCPPEAEKFGLKIYTDINEALHQTDVIYTLRIQEERGAKGFIPSLKEYARTYGITPQRLKLAKKTAILMHPGPVIRNIDIHNDLITHPQSKITQQVENGLALRKTLIWLLTSKNN